MKRSDPKLGTMAGARAPGSRHQQGRGAGLINADQQQRAQAQHLI
jgi:hypothetical protein